MAKVIRDGKHGIQMIRANELVPGDIVEVSGSFLTGQFKVLSQYKVILEEISRGSSERKFVYLMESEVVFMHFYRFAF